MFLDDSDFDDDPDKSEITSKQSDSNPNRHGRYGGADKGDFF